MRRMVEVALKGARDTGGLVDFTLGHEIERAGYGGHLEGSRNPAGAGAEAGAGADARRAPPRRALAPDLAESPRRHDHPPARSLAGRRRRQPRLFADELSKLLDGFDAYVLDCAGDVRVGGRAQLTRLVRVAGPFDGSTLHTFSIAAGSVATSGIGRRSWMVDGGRPAHHLLDPRTGAPAFTGVVQATSLAPTAAEAEVWPRRRCWRTRPRRRGHPRWPGGADDRRSAASGPATSSRGGRSARRRPGDHLLQHALALGPGEDLGRRPS